MSGVTVILAQILSGYNRGCSDHKPDSISPWFSSPSRLCMVVPDKKAGTTNMPLMTNINRFDCTQVYLVLVVSLSILC